MNKIEAQINKHLKGNNMIKPITIIYRNKVYFKTKLDNPSDISKISVLNIWVSEDKKVYPQIWLM